MHVLLTCGGLLPKSALGISVALTLVCSIQAVSNATAGLEVDLSYREASSASWTWAAHSLSD
ncbi:exo1 [Symbiodinium necroappetens]|uniref:Exo1 protein n=1 Tax=Symbiodinium necroappetens TaxID=1628268 RepID=A0A812S1N1_9DINO|nr:exo1 [Symbiodinium necroappetens]